MWRRGKAGTFKDSIQVLEVAIMKRNDGFGFQYTLIFLDSFALWKGPQKSSQSFYVATLLQNFTNTCNLFWSEAEWRQHDEMIHYWFILSVSLYCLKWTRCSRFIVAWHRVAHRHSLAVRLTLSQWRDNVIIKWRLRLQSRPVIGGKLSSRWFWVFTGDAKPYTMETMSIFFLNFKKRTSACVQVLDWDTPVSCQSTHHNSYIAHIEQTTR